MGTQETGGQRAMDLRYFIQSVMGSHCKALHKEEQSGLDLYLIERCERDKEMVELLGGGWGVGNRWAGVPSVPSGYKG